MLTSIRYMYFGKKKNAWYSISQEIQATHICPLKKNQLLERQNKINLSRRMWTLTCKTHVKVIWSMNTWNDPTVITEMLPPTVSPKSIMKLEFLTEVFIFNLPKIWGSVLGQCSIIWTSVCSKFDDSSIRTGLERSQGLRKSCFSGKSCAHIVFLLFVRSTNSHSGDLRHLRQPASNDKQPFGRSAAPTIWIASAISIFKMYTVCLWLRRLHVLDPVW
jgi:hypothetical protein